jgi:RND family efflux transporter MFP subunit
MAPISAINVTAGSTVAKGDVLIELDSRQLQAKLSQLRSALEAAQTAVSQAEKDLKRDAELFKERAVAEARLEQSTTNLDLAKARYEQAKDAVKEAEVTLSYTTILAPQAGTIVDRQAEPGDIAQPGVPLLTLYDPASLRLEVPVMEDLALKLAIGDTLTVHVDALGEDVKAQVDEIVPQAEAASRSFLVKVGLDRSERMFEGMFGRLVIPVGSRRHLCLDTDAIQTVGQLEFVEVVDLDTRTKQRRLITTGKLGMPGRIEVLSGLNAGDYVLRQPANDG